MILKLNNNVPKTTIIFLYAILSINVIVAMEKSQKTLIKKAPQQTKFPKILTPASSPINLETEKITNVSKEELKNNINKLIDQLQIICNSQQ
jgi:hypothetical protein